MAAKMFENAVKRAASAEPKVEHQAKDLVEWESREQPAIPDFMRADTSIDAADKCAAEMAGAECGPWHIDEAFRQLTELPHLALKGTETPD